MLRGHIQSSLIFLGNSNLMNKMEEADDILKSFPIKKFFTPKQYAGLSGEQCRHYAKLRQEYEVLKSLGMSVEMPAFMVKKSKYEIEEGTSRAWTRQCAKRDVNITDGTPQGVTNTTSQDITRDVLDTIVTENVEKSTILGMTESLDKSVTPGITENVEKNVTFGITENVEKNVTFGITENVEKNVTFGITENVKKNVTFGITENVEKNIIPGVTENAKKIVPCGVTNNNSPGVVDKTPVGSEGGVTRKDNDSEIVPGQGSEDTTTVQVIGYLFNVNSLTGGDSVVQCNKEMPAVEHESQSEVPSVRAKSSIQAKLAQFAYKHAVVAEQTNQSLESKESTSDNKGAKEYNPVDDVRSVGNGMNPMEEEDKDIAEDRDVAEDEYDDMDLDQEDEDDEEVIVVVVNEDGEEDEVVGQVSVKQKILKKDESLPTSVKDVIARKKVIRKTKKARKCLAAKLIKDLEESKPPSVLPPKPKFPCGICGHIFNKSTNLWRHRVSFMGKDGLTCHLKKDKITEFKCDECEKIFNRSNNLQRHIQEIHNGEKKKTPAVSKEFKCDKCGKVFNRSNNLRRHQVIHTGERPFSCAVCGQSFKQSSHLMLHVRLHTDEKPFSCSVCEEKFSRKCHMLSHARMHSKEKVFKCDVCGKMFARSDMLRVHKRIHDKEQPYKCEECGRQFNDLSNKRRHVKTHFKK